MRRSDYAFPCGGCMCDKCANSVENIHSESGEAEEPCFNCDECRGYDGDMKKRDAYTDDCTRFRIDDYHAWKARERIKRMNRRNRRK